MFIVETKGSTPPTFSDESSRDLHGRKSLSIISSFRD